MRYSINQNVDTGLYEVTDGECPAEGAFGNATTTKEIVGRFETLDQAIQDRDKRSMFDTLEDAGFACRRYDPNSAALLEVVKYLHGRICRMDGSNLGKVAEMSVFDFVNCYPRAFPNHGMRTFGDEYKE